MPISETLLEGLVIIEPKVIGDDRGYFFEAYNARNLAKKGIQANFVQDNQARSIKGVLRGLHYQVAPFAQAKLVRVIEGEVLDIVVDIRPESPTYGQSFSIILSAANKKQLYVPKGFAHGYLVLSEEAEFFYKCDNYYSAEHEGGIRFDDPTLDLSWPIAQEEIILSKKDLVLPFFGQHRPVH